MRSRSAADAGSVTAEFAVAMPAVLLVLAIGLAGISVAGTQVRLQAAAADAARMLGRGEGAGAVRSRVGEHVAGATITESHSDQLVCARVSLEGRVGPLLIPISARGCALDGG